MPKNVPDEPLELRLIGALTVLRGGKPVKLPQSRKVRGLLAFLALAPRPLLRTQLCELLWDVPDDPRGELRWCLSKIRALIDRPRKRVVSEDGRIHLDLSDCKVDALEIARAAIQGVEKYPGERQRELLGLFGGEFLEGLEIARSPVFNGWLTAQRQRFRACHIALLEHLATGANEKEAFGYLEQWRALAPFDRRVHEVILGSLARRDRIREGAEHLAATIKQFEAEGLDPAPVRSAWRAARAARAAAAGTPQVRSSLILPGDIAPSPRDITTASRRASIAVMPFLDHSTATTEHGNAAGALAHDITTRLAKLRSLFVIAQGTVFALHARHIGPEEAGRMLNVDYVVSGSLRRVAKRLTVSVELVETRTARIVWAEVFDQKLDDAFEVMDEIGNRIVSSVMSEVELRERNRAILRPPNSLDAWEALHRGLWHMYRFTKTDNARAQHFFTAAVKLDPTFARAHAGLSFTHFQNAFQGWANRTREVERACAAAGQSLMIDDRDPAGHWAMGRALWLQGAQEESVGELERAVDLSPNFAIGHYALAFVHSQSGDAKAAIAAADQSRFLSPFDPMLFAMLGSRAIAHVRLGQFAEAAEWSVKAAARPNAHQHIQAIAALSLSLAGQLDEARVYVAKIRRKTPGYGIADYLRSFQYCPEAAALFTKGARRIGMA